MSLEQKINAAWYGERKWTRLLSPLAAFYRFTLERKRHRAQCEKNQHAALTTPILVVGNITVGGTGKTPLILFLCHYLVDKGVRVGVISRGYGGRCQQFPYQVNPKTDTAKFVGDEPFLIASHTSVPVVIAPNRYSAAEMLDQVGEVDLILSDDGMQHFSLPRNAEIVVIDGFRELGNELLLPAGPLREPVKKLDEVDLCLVNNSLSPDQQIFEPKSAPLRHRISGCFHLLPTAWVRVSNGERLTLDQLPFAENRQAIAGIGHPDRFFKTLESQGIQAKCTALNDHQAMSKKILVELGMNDPQTQILMTMKDAVKCRSVVSENCWALDIGLSMNATSKKKVVALLSSLLHRDLP